MYSLKYSCIIVVFIKGIQQFEPNNSLRCYDDKANLKISSLTQEIIEIVSVTNLAILRQFFNRINLQLNTNKRHFKSFAAQRNKAIYLLEIIQSPQKIS